MIGLGPFSLAAPWALAALPLVPLFWFLIRRRPPPPRAMVFPPLRLLPYVQQVPPLAMRPPWWLLLLRLGALILLLLGLAGPSWAPPGDSAPRRLLLVVDNGWTAAPIWDTVRATARAAIDRLPESARVALLATTPPSGGWPDGHAPAPLFAAPDVARRQLDALEPRPWAADGEGVAAAIGKAGASAEADLVLLASDGWGGRALDPLVRLLAVRDARWLRAVHQPMVLSRVTAVASGWSVEAVRPSGGSERLAELVALDDAGRELGRTGLSFANFASTASARLTVPPGLIPRVARLALRDAQSASSAFLIDDSNSRQRVALVSGEQSGAQRPLQAGPYYIRRALEPFAEVTDLPPDQLPPRDAALLLLADAPVAEGTQAAKLRDWVRGGGVAISFAGPRIAENGTALSPTPLRRGARLLGGRLSWDKAQPIQSFAAEGPFAGLTPSPEATVARQLLPIEPMEAGDTSATVDGVSVWARLADGTPLVTARLLGRGALIMLHTTASPDWTSLPLSGLFEAMLRRLLPLARGPAARRAPNGQPFQIDLQMDAAGALEQPTSRASIADGGWNGAYASPLTPPGLYRAGGAIRALNMAGAAGPVTPTFRFTTPAVDLPLAAAGGAPLRLGPGLLTAALLLLAFDGLLGMGLLGRLAQLTRARTPAAALLLMLCCVLPANAQDFGLIPPATSARPQSEQVLLGYVPTGNAAIDSRSAAGLEQLSLILTVRTAIHPGVSLPVHPERDPLGQIALLYWPVLPQGASLSAAATARVRAYLDRGGLILFDTLGGDVSTSRVRALLGGLGLPPLEPLAASHVIARAFYLLTEVSGAQGPVTAWVETGTRGNDAGTTGVVIGGGDWARAWSSTRGEGRGADQALRFGVNLVVYALTGTYKADQAHVRALLERLPGRRP